MADDETLGSDGDGLRAPMASSEALAFGADLAPGTRVGDYAIECKLGHGGMGDVYGAVHPVIGTRVAIKVLRADLASQSVLVERFVREAKSVNLIRHPNIVDVFNFGVLPDTRPFFVMPWLAGQSLAERLLSGLLPLSAVSDVVEAVCRALDAAHGKGVVHRDLKPHNVFLVRVDGDDPHVMLLDFGIAKLLDGGHAQGATTQLLCTPEYAAPEVALHEPFDGRADVYSLGVMTYEMLVGRRPFQGPGPLVTLMLHVTHTPPPPQSERPDLPPALSALVMAMLAKSPDARPTTSEIRRALAEVRRTSTSQDVASVAGSSRPGEEPSSGPVERAPTIDSGAQAGLGSRSSWASRVAVAAGIAALGAVAWWLQTSPERPEAGAEARPPAAAASIAGDAPVTATEAPAAVREARPVGIEPSADRAVAPSAALVRDDSAVAPSAALVPEVAAVASSEPAFVAPRVAPATMPVASARRAPALPRPDRPGASAAAAPIEGVASSSTPAAAAPVEDVASSSTPAAAAPVEPGAPASTLAGPSAVAEPVGAPSVMVPVSSPDPTPRGAPPAGAAEAPPRFTPSLRPASANP